MGVNVGAVLRQGALKFATRVAVVDLGAEPGQRRELSYQQLDARARRVAGALRAHGVQPGDSVALCASNCAELVAAWFGIVYAGAAVVPIPILSAAPELRYRLEHAGCRMLLHDAPRAALCQDAVAGSAAEVASRSIETLSSDEHAALSHPHDTAPGDIALILYTSGTTGKAKGAAISHASLLTHTAVLGFHALRLGTEDRVLAVLPLTHSYGCRMAMLASFFAGARCVLLPRFDAARSIAVLQAEAISWFPAVPTMYAAWVAEADARALPELPALRWCLSAGAPLPDEVARRAEACLGVEIRQGYGLTEATFATINAPPDARVTGSVGKPSWGIELRVVDERGRDVPSGEQGEVWVRGHNVMSHYLHDPEATAAVQHDGFIESGDIGRLDAAGRLTIVDRIKDLIIRGGNNVYPSEVEDALAAHPAVAQVAVIGRPDDYYGEEVVAVVVQREGASLSAQALMAFARERVARTKVPREVALVDSMPLGPSGKVLKRELRAQLIAGRIATEAARERPSKRPGTLPNTRNGES